MRLVCPNCAVHYEVDDTAIPKSGRDVQCSACNHAWFQNPDGSTRPVVQATAARPAPHPDPTPAETTKPVRPPTSRRLDPVIAEILREEAAREARARRGETPDMIEGQTEMALEEPTSEPVDAAPSPPVPEPESQPKTEAETRTEAKADPEPRPAERLPEIAPQADAKASSQPDAEPVAATPAEPATPETPAAQTAEPVEIIQAVDNEAPPEEDTPVSAVPDPVSEPEPVARQTEEAAPATAAASTGAKGEYAPRKDLLPDIEEINSSLRAQGGLPHRDMPGDEARAQREERGRGFRWGFSTVMLVFAAILLIYAYAPGIVEAVPAMEPAVQFVVTVVNDALVLLDRSMESASALLAGFLGDSNS